MREVQLSEIARCKSKDSKLVGQIFLRLHPSLISLCYRYLGSFSDAEDVVMISWIKVLERISDFQYEHPLSFYGWIKKICINESLGILRKRNNFHLISLSDLPEDSQPHFDEFSNIDTQTLLSLVAQLPDGYRTVFNLFAIEGYSHAEISQLLQISESTSKSQFRKARLSLAQSIKSTFNESVQSNHNHDNTQGI